MRVLVTGSGGAIGRALGKGLVERGHQLRGLDFHDSEEQADDFTLGWIAGDCLDADTVAVAVQGVDAVVHLAGNPDEGSLAESLTSHVHTTAVLLDAMVRRGIATIAYASSNHAVGRTKRREILTTTTRPRPDTFYGTAKVAAEALLSLYADRYEIGAVAMRIGSFQPAPTSRRQLSTWLSPDDCVSMVDAAIAVETGYHVIYGVSANTRGWWDLEPGHRIGYRPRDDAERYAAEISSSEDDETENAYVGGPFVAAAFERPAF